MQPVPIYCIAYLKHLVEMLPIRDNPLYTIIDMKNTTIFKLQNPPI